MNTYYQTKDSQMIGALKTFSNPEPITLNHSSCPGCSSMDISMFYTLKAVPAHSVLIMPSRSDAINYPKGNIALGFCHNCGFISNLAFDPSLLEYCSECEESQGFSDTFNSFHRNLAQYLINKFDLYNKDIIEIGCGKGDFLTLLCQLGNNRGIGFDPAFVRERFDFNNKIQVKFIEDFFSEKYSHYKADFICCKMTLEHIHQTKHFVTMVRNSIQDRLNTIVFFQVPNVMQIFNEFAFWDIYYEHCSYFSVNSLRNLFENSDFYVINTWLDYDEQYLMIEAKPEEENNTRAKKNTYDTLYQLTNNVILFTKNYRSIFRKWHQFLNQAYRQDKKIVLWGSGSKAVSFLTTLKIYDLIRYVVDINSYRWDTFIAGTGQKIVSPDFLTQYKPDIVIVMNPIYIPEVKSHLH